MTMININRKITDPFNRYKMQKLVVQVIYTSNCFKTILVNISGVAKDLHRSPLYLTKYFAFELSTSMRFDEKSNLYTLNGDYHRNKLQDLLDNFIRQFVLCRFCENPETDLNRDEKNSDKIHQRCYACGNTSAIKTNCHKFVKFILKNWSQENNNPYELETTNIFEKENISLNEPALSNDWDNENDDLSSFETNCEEFISLFQKKKFSNQLIDLNSIEELINEAERLQIMSKAPFYIAKYLFTDEILKEIDQYEMLFYQFSTNSNEGQYSLLDGIEIIISSNENLLNENEISKIFYKLYEKNLVFEEIFFDWYEKESTRTIQKTIETDIHEYAKGFINWLRTAEEINDDDDDEK
ncbi:hypothetical protein I4U23_022712 [Adineta vaga]|nr:hypothetical protein I4U23_022712 [Adineta vaga]